LKRRRLYLNEESTETSTTQVPQRCNEKRREASTTPVPHFALFAHKALLGFEAMNSNNAKCGTSHDEARSADRVCFANQSRVFAV
jgi:hypothetical protein